MTTSTENGWDEDETQKKYTIHPDTLLTSIKAWIDEEMSFLISCGFKERTHQSLMKDVLSFLESRKRMRNVEPKDQWATFLDIYPVLKIKLPTVDFIKKGHHTLGVGKLFSPTRDNQNEAYWESFFSSRQYGGIELPATIYRPGEWILSRHGTRGQVMSVSSAGYLCQLDGSADTMTVKLWDAAEAPASGGVDVATAGISEPLCTLETPPTAPDDEETARKATEDAEMDARLAEILAID